MLSGYTFCIEIGKFRIPWGSGSAAAPPAALVRKHSLACPAVWTAVDAAATTPLRPLRSAETVSRVTGVADVSSVALVVTAAVAARSDVRGGGVCRPVTVAIGSARALRNRQVRGD